MFTALVRRVFAICLTVAGVVGVSGSGTALADGSRDVRNGTGRSAVTAIAEAVPVRDATALKLDGELTDEVWSRAPVIEGFLQREPNEGAAPTYATEARVAYDARHIYVAVLAHDPEPDKIVGYLTRRDTGSPSDWIRVAIDSYHDRRTAFEFSVNPAGVKQDKYYFNDASEDQGWDAVWDVAVTKHAAGWRAEFRIPLSQLRFPRSEKPTFGLAIVRQMGRLNEMSTWPLIAKSTSGIVSQFGELHGLELSQSPKRLELMPYSVAQVGTVPATDNPLVKTPDPDASFGLDMKYAITPALTLTATVNPDFGQVEADPAVVNLSAFETFFSERRPFFVEGSGVFRFDMDCNDGACTGLFYTRRIGRRPQLEAETPENGFAAAPVNTTILGATKITGRIGGFSVGVLNALTSEESAQVADGRRNTSAVRPFAGYGRTPCEKFADRRRLASCDGTNRRLGGASSPLRTGGAACAMLGQDWRRAKNSYAIAGYWARTIAARAAMQRGQEVTSTAPASDADRRARPTRTSLGWIGSMASAGPRRAGAVRIERQLQGARRFERSGLHPPRRQVSRGAGCSGATAGQVRPRSRSSISGRPQLRRRIASASAATSTRTGRSPTTGRPAAACARGSLPAVDPGPGAKASAASGAMESDNAAVSVNVFFGGGQSEFGRQFLDVNPGVTFRPTPSLSVSGGFRFSDSDNDAQWVTNETDAADKTHYVFARLDQRTVALTTRVNYTMSPTLSLQVYAEPFVSAGEYTGYKELVDGRARNWEDRYAPYAYASSADFNYRSFRTTNVLRWEYRPGSALFVVWQQGREEDAAIGRFRFGRDFSGVFDAPANNVFLVKFSYWLNY